MNNGAAKGYVIGKFEDKTTVKAVIARLKQEGFGITHDWTDDPGSDGLTGLARLRDIRRSATEDAAGANTADFIVVVHHPELCNGLVELGIALGNVLSTAPTDEGPVICVIGARDPVARRQPIFYQLPDINHFETVEGAVQFLKQVYKERWE